MRQPGSCERPDLGLAVVVGAGAMARAIARRLGQSYRLLIADRDADALDRLTGAMKDEGLDAQTHRCDITIDDDVSGLAARAGDLGPPRVLVHVVGLSPSMGNFDAIIAVNLIGARRVERAFLPLAVPGTCAIFISSMGGHVDDVPPPVQTLMDDDPLAPGFARRFAKASSQPGSNNLAYQLSKFAMNRMCRREVRPAFRYAPSTGRNVGGDFRCSRVSCVGAGILHHRDGYSGRRRLGRSITPPLGIGVAPRQR